MKPMGEPKARGGEASGKEGLGSGDRCRAAPGREAGFLVCPGATSTGDPWSWGLAAAPTASLRRCALLGMAGHRMLGAGAQLPWVGSGCGQAVALFLTATVSSQLGGGWDLFISSFIHICIVFLFLKPICF